MASSVATVAGGLVGLAAVGTAAALGTAVARRERAFLPGSLATGLDITGDPLTVAVRRGYAGIELGVRRSADGELCVADRDTTGRPFAAAVLAPLVARFGSKPSKRERSERGEPFMVILDNLGTAADRPDGGPEAVYEKLDELLRPHAAMLTGWAGGRVTPGAVTVVLTGAGWPRKEISLAYERHAFIEGGFGDLESPTAPPTLVPIVRETLADRLGWDERDRDEELPAEARHILRSMVRVAHADGRQVRFVDVPDGSRRIRLALWRELHAAGVDYIGTDRVALLARFLRGAGARRHPTHALNDRSLNAR